MVFSLSMSLFFSNNRRMMSLFLFVRLSRVALEVGGST